MVFRVLLFTALFIFILGLIYRIYTWFSWKINLPAAKFTFTNRISAFVRGFAGVLFNIKVLTLLKVFLLDVILQRKVLKESFYRWLMHIFIYLGFILLLLMHALGAIVTNNIVDEYYSTLNPFFFLRDLFGLIVVVGVGMAVYRRSLQKIPRLKSNAMDRYAIMILAIIMLSGFFLEGVKITSHSDFTRMVEDYADTDDEEEIRMLESLWVKEFGLVSPNVSGPFEDDILEQGREIHELSCLGCHAPARHAFIGYGTAKVISPFALWLDQIRTANLLYFLHILACFVGLAYLPFSKMIHVLATPLSLLANAVMDKKHSHPANMATRQILELDACTHCGSCTLYCSAMMAYEAVGNELILPSEKMRFLKSMSAGKELDKAAFQAIQEGVYLCTNCDRCTVVCPSGINLKDLWLSVRENLIQKGIPEPLILSPFSLVRGLSQEDSPKDDYLDPLETARNALAGAFRELADPAKDIDFPLSKEHITKDQIVDPTFSYCFGCQNCTTVCPVVGQYEDPQSALGLLPHQIMWCMGLGLDEMASGANMLWDCVTCYQCQEHCPQQVKVTDILYDLKYKATVGMEKRVGLSMNRRKER